MDFRQPTTTASYTPEEFYRLQAMDEDDRQIFLAEKLLEAARAKKLASQPQAIAATAAIKEAPVEDADVIRFGAATRRLRPFVNKQNPDYSCKTLKIRDLFYYPYGDRPRLKEMTATHNGDALRASVLDALRPVALAFKKLCPDILERNFVTNENYKDFMRQVAHTTVDMAMRPYYGNRRVEELFVKNLWGSLAEHVHASLFQTVAGSEKYEGARFFDLITETKQGPKKLEVKARDQAHAGYQWPHVDYVYTNRAQEHLDERKRKSQWELLVIYTLDEHMQFQPNALIEFREYDQFAMVSKKANEDFEKQVSDARAQGQEDPHPTPLTPVVLKRQFKHGDFSFLIGK